MLPSILLISSSLIFSGCGEKPTPEKPAAQSMPASTAQVVPAATAQTKSKGVIEPRTNQEFDQLLADNKLVVLDFYAVWCGPCKQFAPKFDALSKEFTNVTFIKIDTQKLPDVSHRYGIQSIPTIILVINGKEVKRPDRNNLKNELTNFQS